MQRLAFSSAVGVLARRTWGLGGMRCLRVVQAVPLAHSRHVRFPQALAARAEAAAAAEAEAGGPPAAEEVDPGAIAGTDLRILRYPHPLLRAENREFDASELGEAKALAREMLMVMYASRGIGLAAPQVGVNRRLLVFNVTGDPKKWTHETVLVNPRVVGMGKPTEVDGEACLSFPDMSGKIARPAWVKIEALKLSGRKTKMRFEGWKARVFLHEFDHLDGVLYVDRLDDEDKQSVQPRLQQLVQEYNDAPYEAMAAAL